MTERIPATKSSASRAVKLEKAFHWIWGGQAVSITGSQLSAITFQLIAVTSLHASSSQMGVLTAAQTFPYLVLGLLIGVVVDRSSRRTLLVISDLSRSAVLLVAAVLAIEKHLSIHVMWAVVCLTATFNLVFDASLGAYVPEILKPHHWSIANSRLSATLSAGEVAGPAIGGFIVQAVAAPFVVLLDALSYVFSAACILISKPAPGQRPPDIAAQRTTESRTRIYNPIPGIVEGLRFVITHPVLRILGFWSAIWNFAWSAVIAVLVLYESRVLHVGSASIGLCFAAGGIGGIVGALLANVLGKTFSPGSVLVYAPFVGAAGAATILIPHAHPSSSLAFGLFLFNAGQSAFGVNMQTTRQMVTPPFLMGRMDTTMRLCFTGMSSLGALTGGFIGSNKGPHVSIVLGILGLFVAAIGLRVSPLAKLIGLGKGLAEPSHSYNDIDAKEARRENVGS